LPVGELLNPILEAVTNSLLPALVDPISDAVLGDGALDTIFRPVVEAANTALTPVFGVISDTLISLTANVQETPGDFIDDRGFDEGSFTERALQLTLLPDDPLLQLSLASATVRGAPQQATDVQVTSPEDGAEITVPEGG